MADKWQALDEFWGSFNIPAYDENEVPDDAKTPYITYEAGVSDFENPIVLSASIWHRSSRWDIISQKANQIANTIGNYYLRKIDNGYMFISKGSSFAMRSSDPNDETMKRIFLNITVEFFTEN